MNPMHFFRQLWATRHLPPHERAAERDPDLRDARRQLHADRTCLQQLAARKWLREHGRYPDEGPAR